MSNLSLLVDCLKIINWLEDRKKLRKDWYNYLKAGEEKIKVLLKDKEWAINYPAIHEYLTANELNFNVLDVDKVAELLLGTDLAKEKSMLFGYSDKQVKEWTTLKKYLGGNHLNLLNLAKFIEQSLRFDLPGLDKTIESYDTQLATLKRKIDFNNNTIFQEQKGLEKERVLLGVESEDKFAVEKLIESVVSRGPHQIELLQKMVTDGNIQKYVQYYNECNDRNDTVSEVSTLQYFINNGDAFEEVFKDASKKEQYTLIKKYKDFENWKGTNEWQIIIEGVSHEQKQNVNESTVLQTRQFRQKLLYDLNQLLFFFKGSKHEIATAEKGLGFQSEQSRSQTMVEGEIDKAILELQKIIKYLTSKKLTAPLELKNSKKAYQLLVSQFMGYEANIAAMKTQIESYKGQIIELQQNRQKEVEKLMFLRRKVASCRPLCEGWLSEIVKRDVKITGDINKLD